MRKCLWILFVGLFVLGGGILLIVGCSSDGTPVGPGGTAATDPLPADSTASVSLLTVLFWSYPDFDPDLVTFDIYLGTDNPPPLLASGLTDTTYDPGPLGIDKTYYWKIVSHPSGGTSGSSPVWVFGTNDTFTYPFKIGNSWD